jgi:hypothetical protein
MERGLTLIELVLSTALLVGGGGALLLGMHQGLRHSDYLRDLQVALNAVQGRLQELSATEFTTLWTGVEFTAARTAAGQCMGLYEDRNCDGILQAPEDLNANGALDEPLAGARLWVRLREIPPGATNPTLLDLYVSACWTSRSRAIGEDNNCNGVLEAGEDDNANGWLDSPAAASTRVAVRE